MPLFAKRVLQKEFDEWESELIRKTEVRSIEQDQEIEKLKDRINELESRLSQRLDDEASARSSADHKLTTALQDASADLRAADEQLNTQLNEAQAKAAVDLQTASEQAHSALETTEGKLAKRLDRHASDLRKIGNALSGKLFDLASFKLERQRDRINIIMEDDSVLNSEGVAAEGPSAFSPADQEVVANLEQDPSSADAGAACIEKTEEGDDAEKLPGEEEENTTSPSFRKNPIVKEGEEGLDEVPRGPQEDDSATGTSSSLSRSRRRPTPQQEQFGGSQPSKLQKQQLHQHAGSVERYRPFTKPTRGGSRCKRVEWLIQDASHKLQVYETGQPLYSPEFTVNLDYATSATTTGNINVQQERVLKRARLVFYPRGSSIVAKPGYCSVFLQFPLDDPANPSDDLVTVGNFGGFTSAFPSGAPNVSPHRRRTRPPLFAEHNRFGGFSSPTRMNNIDPPGALPLAQEAESLRRMQQQNKIISYTDSILSLPGKSPLDAILRKNLQADGILPRDQDPGLGTDYRGIQVSSRNNFWFRYRLQVGNFVSTEVLDTIYKGVDNFCEVLPHVDNDEDTLTVSVEFLAETSSLSQVGGPDEEWSSPAGRAFLAGRALLQHSEPEWKFPSSKEGQPVWEQKMPPEPGTAFPSLGGAGRADQDEGEASRAKNNDDEKEVLSPSIKQHYAGGRYSGVADFTQDKEKSERDRDHTSRLLSSTTEFVSRDANLFFPFERLDDRMKNIGVENELLEKDEL
ncbi:unnamed protein product [Amoebophrya sp. A25]|nr:unnamed protein product [Amoebophrya sp. A25]|eukprot:GSA25T00009328001.1